VVTDRRESQASRVLEVLGIYDPSSSPAKFAIDEARLAHWVGTGAQVSESLRRLLKTHSKVTSNQ
jgi:small subunit ribosomal protein S16